jgi:hypothetical protein
MSTVKQPLVLDPASNPTPGAVCIPNINTAERRKRLRFGVITFALSLIVVAFLVVSGANRLLRLPLILLFWSATTGYFQWRDKTCVGLARLDSRHVGDSMEKIEDAAELAQVKRQARQVRLKAFLAALPLTLIALLLPVL